MTVSILGVDSDNREVKTRTVKNNGFNPVWNEKFDFPLRCSAVAHILIWCVIASLFERN